MVRLFKTKHQLEKELTELKTTLFTAEHAVANCDRLETEIPLRIASIRARNALPRLADGVEACFSHRDLFMREIRTIGALERLQKDLPEIRRHWEKKLAALQ
jgi:hypothetical protein